MRGYQDSGPSNGHQVTCHYKVDADEVGWYVVDTDLIVFAVLSILLKFSSQFISRKTDYVGMYCGNSLVHAFSFNTSWESDHGVNDDNDELAGARTPADEIDGLVQERRNSIALAMELRLSCTNPSKCWSIPVDYKDQWWLLCLLSDMQTW